MADQTPLFHLSNGYNLDFFQSARLLKWLGDHRDRKLQKQVAAVDLGFTYIMIRYISGISAAMGLIDIRGGGITRLGEALLKIDPYLTAPFSPWIIHYNLASDPRHIIWHRMVNCLIYSERVFELEAAKMQFNDLQRTYAAGTVMTHVMKELGAFFEAYTNGALSRLAYLKREDQKYIAPSAMHVSPVVFGYSLLTFAERYHSGETAISVSDISAAMSSPGRVFRFVNPPDPADYLLTHFEDTED
jgi:hypothetical protein